MASRSEDDVLLSAVRLAMSVSVHAADEIGDVSTAQLRALTVLRRNPGGNLGQLADAMGVTVSTASRLVERLVSAGLVDRRQSVTNRREVTLSLTGQGRTMLNRYDQIRLTELRRCLASVPADERATVLEGLRLLIDAAGHVRVS